MWNKLRSLFASAAKAPGPESVFEGVDQLAEFAEVSAAVDRVLELDISSASARTEHAARIETTLDELAREVKLVRRLANGYPETEPINGAVWMNGAGYGVLGASLTEHFRHADWLAIELRASKIWVNAVLAVNSHYHHLVGPAMIACADAQGRSGHADARAEMFRAVVLDFAFLVDDLEPDIELEETEVVSLQSLRTAAAGLLAAGMEEIEGLALADIVARVDAQLDPD
ncbi:MAG: hypothetical protein AAF078_02135 [Planctomycetota bacterium]